MPPYRSAAYACRSRSATADADRRTAVGHKSTDVGDHALACPRTGLLARRAKVVERAWVRVAREAVGAEGQVVPQQWRAEDRRRLDLVIYGATPNGSALCCDATLVSPLTRRGQPQPGRRAPEARRAWKRSRRSLQKRCAPFGTRPGSATVLQSTAGFTGRSGFRLDASLVGHAVCRSAAGGCQHCPRLAVAAAAAFHQRRGPSARPRTRPRRGRRAEPPAAATPGVAIACRP